MNLDDEETRPRVPAFLKKHGIRLQVLMGEEEALTGYDHRFVPALYVIDRKGTLVGLPGEFRSDLEKALDSSVLPLLAGKAPRPPWLLTLEEMPAGYGVLWKRAVDGRIDALAVAPASGGTPGVIGGLTSQTLRRWSAEGDALGQSAVDLGKDDLELRGVDLDGDGRAEWLAGNGKGYSLLDAEGDSCWSYFARGDSNRVLGFPDLDGDGAREILFQEDGSIVAHRHVPGILWTSGRLGDLRAATLLPGEGIAVQIGEKVRQLDQGGRVGGGLERAPRNMLLAGRTRARDGRPLSLYWDGVNPERGLEPVLDRDIDGDGRNDVIIPTYGGLRVFTPDGSLLLSVVLGGDRWVPHFAAGDLDGRPGDELVLYIEQYGLVVLGFLPPAAPGPPASAPAP